ncbi:MAG: hypothetical protein QGH60_12760 [Phycisphaerae bacterium]|jgi:hypothetical protein|nr:hypothetical protein [Phycisphaerae bacterium]
MTPEELREAIQSQAVEGKVSCKAMLDLARDTETSSQQIGEICNELDIKVGACQLGCFK